jgi:hypothetical protein
MSYPGIVQNGVVVLENGALLKNGTRVQVTVEEQTPETESLRQLLLRYAGTIDGLPDDMARNHDHYLHGLPKK